MSMTKKEKKWKLGLLISERADFFNFILYCRFLFIRGYLCMMYGGGGEGGPVCLSV